MIKSTVHFWRRPATITCSSGTSGATERRRSRDLPFAEWQSLPWGMSLHAILRRRRRHRRPPGFAARSRYTIVVLAVSVIVPALVGALGYVYMRA